MAEEGWGKESWSKGTKLQLEFGSYTMALCGDCSLYTVYFEGTNRFFSNILVRKSVEVMDIFI